MCVCVSVDRAGKKRTSFGNHCSKLTTSPCVPAAEMIKSHAGLYFPIIIHQLDVWPCCLAFLTNSSHFSGKPLGLSWKLILIKISPICNCHHKSSPEPFKELHQLICFPHPLQVILPSMFCVQGPRISKSKSTVSTMRLWQIR